MYGQEFSYTHFSIPEGLVQTQVQCLFQDSRGYIWIGTKGGLSRFDGQEFTNFTKANGLENNFISQILEDSQGRIWARTKNGITIIDTRDRITNSSSGLPEREMEYMYINNHNETMVVFYLSKDFSRGLAKYSKGKFQIISDTIFENGKRAKLDLDSRYSFQYETSTDRLFFVNPKDKLAFYINNKVHSFNTGEIYPIEVNKCSDNNIYFIANSGIYRIEKNKFRFICKIRDIRTTAFNSFDISIKGEIIFSNMHDRLTRISDQSEFYDAKNFGAGNLVLFDRENNLWIGNDATGLYMVRNRAFVNYIPEKCGILPYIFSIVEDQSHSLWFGSLTRGLCKYDGHHFKNITAYKSLTKFDNFYPGSLLTKDGTLLIAINSGLFRVKNDKFQWFFSRKADQCIFLTKEDTIRHRIISSSSQRIYIKEKNGREIIVPLKAGNKKSNSNISLSIDPANRYWISSFTGMSIYDDGKITNLPTPEYPYNGGAISQYWDEKGRLWMGSETGLFLLEKNKCTRIEADIFSSYVNAISRLDENHILFGTINGLGVLDLSVFNKTSEIKIDVYNFKNGYEGIEVNQNGIFKDSKGFFWIINSDRVVRMDPKSLDVNSFPPPVFIKKVYGFGENMRQFELLSKWTHDTLIALSRQTNKLKFEFVALSYRSTALTRFQYQLEGYDKQWSAPLSENYAIYTNLSPGHYIFRVKAINHSGVISKEAAVIHIFIKPAFWQTWWFILLVVSIFLASIIGITLKLNNIRRNKKQQSLKNENALIDLQLKTIRNQIDPHFTFNAMNSIAAVIYKEDKLKAYSYFTRFSGLIRAVLESSDKTERSLHDEIEFVKNYLELEKLRFKEKFEYSITVDPGINLSINVPKLIVQAYVENSLKHGLMHKESDGLLTILIKSREDSVIIEVTDNGVGRTAAREFNKNNPAYSGKGLQIMEQYYELFEKLYHIRIWTAIEDLYDPNGISAGTKVSVHLPHKI